MSVEDEHLVGLWDSGLTMTEIGEAVGLSRERVRQRLKRYQRAGSNPNRVPSMEAIRSAVSQEFGLRNVARRLKVSVTRLVRGIERFGMENEVEVAFAARLDYWRDQSLERTRRDLVERIRAIAAVVGHTPTQGELMAHDIYHVTLARYFGSAAEAMQAAGLQPNVRGRRPQNLPADDATPRNVRSGEPSNGHPAS